MRSFGIDSKRLADGIGIDRSFAEEVRCWRIEEKSRE